MSTEKLANQNQEIDLLDLLFQIGRGIKSFLFSLIKGLLFLIVFGIKKIHIILLFTLVGVAIGYLLYNTSKRYYSSNMVAQTNGITSSDMIDYINDLHELNKKGNKKGLAHDLQMPDSTAEKIKDIQAFYIIDANKDGIGDYVDYKNTYNPKDTSVARLEDRIHLAVEVFDNTAFENVKNGLFRYMSRNPYLIKLNEIRKRELQELIHQTAYEIIKLDSLQNTDYFQITGKSEAKTSQMLFLAEKEPTMYYKDKMTLVRQKQYYQKELELATDAFTVIKDFTSLAVAENPRISYLIKYGIGFLILGYLILLGIHFRKKISFAMGIFEKTN